MAKFKTDGFKIGKDMMSRGIFSDVRVYKDRGHIQVIAVKDGMIHTDSLGYHSAFNKYKDQLDVEAAIDKFIEGIK
jgi:hypothetical protein